MTPCNAHLSSGPWKAPQVDNPNYQGEWVHPQIDNPEYEADDNLYLYEDFGVLGFDLWQVCVAFVKCSFFLLGLKKKL